MPRTRQLPIKKTTSVIKKVRQKKSKPVVVSVPVASPKSISRKKRLALQVMAVLFLFAGVAFIVFPHIIPEQTETEITLNEPIRPDSSFVASASVVTNVPTQIVIPSVNIDLPIVVAPLKKGYWQTSLKTASFGEGSALPGTNSNTVIFAHAKEGLFLPLKGIKQGASVYVFTNNRYFRYTVTNIQEVAPTDVYIVKPTETEQLTLFTCTGFLDKKRLVVIATPK